MEKTKENLVAETRKWLERLEKKAKTVKSTGKMSEEHMKEVIRNMNAYISDCKHFMEIDDWVRAYEAVIYAWGIYETLVRLNLIEGRID